MQNTAQQILGAELQNISEDGVVTIAQLEHICRTIRFQRQERNNLPHAFNAADIPVFPQNYQKTAEGKQFLVFSNGVGRQDRMLIFGTNQGLQLLGRCEHLFEGCVFKVCPELFFSYILFMRYPLQNFAMHVRPTTK